MVTIYDVPAEALIDAVADSLADDLEPPEWAEIVKTGPGRELPPDQQDFWAVRAAALLRKIAMDGPVGVDRLSSAFGTKVRGSTRYGFGGRKHTGGSRKIIRLLLQELEELDYVETASGEGRRITPAGQSFLDGAAADVLSGLDRPDLERYA